MMSNAAKKSAAFKLIKFTIKRPGIYTRMKADKQSASAIK